MVKLVSDRIARPWAIVLILPNAQHYTAARFVNRQDADDHKRVLQRFMPARKFEIIFDPPDEEEQDDQA
ncbi:MAG: hypothetical protein M3O33_13100 [Cyanobacteriota bacterium]|nr:hypothetical protein [Cyanobacteriota bacterium]